MHILDFAKAKQAFDDHDAAVASAREFLKDVQRDLFTAAVNIAVTGVWREWDASVPEGTDFEFEPEALLDCGDANVVRLITLVYAIEDMQFGDSCCSGPIP